MGSALHLHLHLHLHLNLHGNTAHSALHLTVKVAGGGTSVHA